MTLAYREVGIGSSFISRWDARWKLAGIGLAAIGIGTLNELLPCLLAFTLAVLLASVGKISFRITMGRAVLLSLTVLPYVFLAPLTDRAPVAVWDFWGIGISQKALELSLALLFRVVSIGLLTMILIRTTPIDTLASAARALGMPRSLVEIFRLAHRYLMLLFAEARRMRIATRTRGFQPRLNLHTYRTISYGLAALLVRSGDRADTVAEAMQCRGYAGQMHQIHEFQTLFRDTFAFIFMILLTIALIVIDRQMS